MVLHCLSATPGSDAFERCLQLAGPEDTVLLMGDAGYALLPNADAEAVLRDCTAQLCALTPEMDARGIDLSQISDVTAVDDAGFVRLSEIHVQQVAWY
ncbi:MAG: sulfurtransferase complex subunit TusB [Pseudomonadota bacterium]